MVNFWIEEDYEVCVICVEIEMFKVLMGKCNNGNIVICIIECIEVEEEIDYGCDID